MIVAAHRNKMDALAYLLEHGCYPNAKDLRGRTALLMATVANHTAAVLKLLQYGADPSIENDAGASPLRVAMDLGLGEVQDLLMDADKLANSHRCETISQGTYEHEMELNDGRLEKLSVKGITGQRTSTFQRCIGNMFIYSASSTTRTASEMERQVAPRVNPGLDSNEGKLTTSGSPAASSTVTTTTWSSKPAIMKNALKSNQITESGEALKAASNKLFEIVFSESPDLKEIDTVLMEHPKAIDMLNEDGFTPLMSAAAIKGAYDLVLKLLEHSANINVQTEKADFMTPLMMAAFNGDKRMLKILVENGANLDLIMPQNGLNALAIARFLGARDVDAISYLQFVEANAYNKRMRS